MNSNHKKYLSFLWKTTIFLFLILSVLFPYHQKLYSPIQDSIVTSNENTSYSKISEYPQYKLILNLQTAFVRNAKIVGPVVVNISKLHEVTNHNTFHVVPLDKDNSWLSSLKYWFVKKLREKKYISETIGSGVIINNKGYILTNYHVIENHNKILVRLSDKREFFAKVIGVDPKTDLAVLKVNSFRSLPQPSFGLSHNVEVGQWVMAIGNPYGLQGSVTVGVISGVGRSNLGITTYENFIQTDASINPGNSGGPLIDLNGKIIGINTSVAAIGSGVGFAIPIEMALRIVEELIDNGDVERGWLGVGMQRMTPELFAAFKMPSSENGVLINRVENNTPAKSGGMMQGDIVLQYDGKQVRNAINFQHMVANTQVGKQVSINVIREGLEKTLIIIIGKLTS